MRFEIKTINKSDWRTRELAAMVRQAFIDVKTIPVTVQFESTPRDKVNTRFTKDKLGAFFAARIKLPEQFTEAHLRVLASHLRYLSYRARGARSPKTPHQSPPSWMVPLVARAKRERKKDERDLVQKRADHAFRMYERAVKARHAAEVRERKWKTKVAYYERTLKKSFVAKADVDKLKDVMDDARGVFDDVMEEAS